jgi:NAD-dependent deacetylase
MDASTAVAIRQAAAALKRASRVVAITGAGISAESGVPTFRGEGGLWRTFRAEDLATPEAFARDPVLVWEWYWWRRARIAGVRPNPGHAVLARFEARFPAFTLLTQNVDGLHAEAGSRNLVELHGNIWRARCNVHRASVFDQRGEPIPRIDERAGAAARAVSRPDLPLCPSCAAVLRPDVVWFGESLDPGCVARAIEAVDACDVLLVVGTSGVVYPVAALPSMARRRQSTIIEVNVEATALTADADVVLRGPSGAILPELERQL